jgi:hypothetical protein
MLAKDSIIQKPIVEPANRRLAMWKLPTVMIQTVSHRGKFIKT